MKGKITMKKSKNKKLTLTTKNKKLIDKFIKMISDMNKKQNKTVTSYYSFKETLTDYLKVILSEQWNGELKKQIEKAGS